MMAKCRSHVLTLIPTVFAAVFQASFSSTVARTLIMASRRSSSDFLRMISRFALGLPPGGFFVDTAKQYHNMVIKQDHIYS